jgi:hypothetical protein
MEPVRHIEANNNTVLFNTHFTDLYRKSRLHCCVSHITAVYSFVWAWWVLMLWMLPYVSARLFTRRKEIHCPCCVSLSDVKSKVLYISPQTLSFRGTSHWIMAHPSTPNPPSWKSRLHHGRKFCLLWCWGFRCAETTTCASQLRHTLSSFARTVPKVSWCL